MLLFALIVLVLALLATVFTLGREIRIRKALEKLLHILLSPWRHDASSINSPKDHPANVDSPGHSPTLHRSQESHLFQQFLQPE